MTHYALTITRADADDKAWTVVIDGHPDWGFREKNFTAIDTRVRELAQQHDGIAPDRVALTYACVRIGDVEITAQLHHLNRLRHQAREVADQIDNITDDLIAALRREAGLSTRDTAAVLGLSHARISQREHNN
ncbi:hypothetical protein MX572_23575 (plasmid) [Rhodococcus pyridinivorans]|uniref:hypothetical protein n=1 Tax=Rhodococcus pyridinivorans TaxID=103816 RepID=UPI0020C60792|nr:hypothetical protein [Rhodococcus pyridinivorans]UTM39701.1 hypothetical protein MX572_23575 [Rhodococcus pyridinivorans]